MQNNFDLEEQIAQQYIEKQKLKNLKCVSNNIDNNKNNISQSINNKNMNIYSSSSFLFTDYINFQNICFQNISILPCFLLNFDCKFNFKYGYIMNLHKILYGGFLIKNIKFLLSKNYCFKNNCIYNLEFGLLVVDNFYSILKHKFEVIFLLGYSFLSFNFLNKHCSLSIRKYSYFDMNIFRKNLELITDLYCFEIYKNFYSLCMNIEFQNVSVTFGGGFFVKEHMLHILMHIFPSSLNVINSKMSCECYKSCMFELDFIILL